MAKVKILLNPGETREDVEEMLIKAFQKHAAGEEHKEAFQDPAARDVFNKIIRAHEKTFEKILKEVNKVIDEDV